jgi:hypothetical protein
MVRLSAACLGCLGFSVSIVSGLVAGNPAETILLRALYALAAFAALGWVLGGLAYLVVDEHARGKAAELWPKAPTEVKRDRPAASDAAQQPSAQTMPADAAHLPEP